MCKQLFGQGNWEPMHVSLLISCTVPIKLAHEHSSITTFKTFTSTDRLSLSPAYQAFELSIEEPLHKFTSIFTVLMLHLQKKKNPPKLVMMGSLHKIYNSFGVWCQWNRLKYFASRIALSFSWLIQITSCSSQISSQWGTRGPLYN